MSNAEEITYLDEARAGAERRLDECEREIKLTKDVGERQADDETARRSRKLIMQTERYRELILRLADEVASARRTRLAAIEETEAPRLMAAASRLHRRCRRLQTAQDRTRDQFRGLRMRHLAMDREIRELSKALDLPPPDTREPDEIKRDLGRFHEEGEA